jgi:outer membrane protein TolC
LTLSDCIHLGLERQPALAAARASLAAAEDARRALEDLRFAALVSHELPVRRSQADLGVAIAGAGLRQAEWETIYAITRTYFTALYAREQEKVARDLVERLVRYRGTAERLLKAGNPDVKLYQSDVDRLSVNIDLFQGRQIPAAQGILRAKAALREAVGLDPGCIPLLAGGSLPGLQDGLCRDELLALALSRRGELTQAADAARLTELEVNAQAAAHGPTAHTFAAYADIHARPIPQGMANKEYRPWAIGLDMPTMLAGHREDRMQRARDLSARAAAVVEKTRNLIALELDDSYYKWQEAAGRLRALAGSSAKAEAVLKATEARFEVGNVPGADMILAKTLESLVRAEYNEVLYQHALALAALERITAGGFRLGHGVAAPTAGKGGAAGGPD